MKHWIPMVALLLPLLCQPLPTAASEYIIAPGEDNLVSFLSKAPMEKFEGKTHEISGSLSVDLSDLSAPVLVEVQVDLASLDTGMKKRNQHMCENHLETDRFPAAVFKADELLDASVGSVASGEEVTFSLKGEFSLHGVTREITVPVELNVGQDGSLRVKSHFQVKLADYEIKRPKFLILKLDEVQRVSIDLIARNEG